MAAATGIITTVAGSGAYDFSGDGGLATAASLRGALDVAVDGVGNLYIADYANNRIRMVTASTGVISTLAGTGDEVIIGDGGPATAASLLYPYSVAADADGNVIIADTSHHRIRLVTAATGVITTVAGTGVGSS